MITIAPELGGSLVQVIADDVGRGRRRPYLSGGGSLVSSGSRERHSRR